MLKPRRQVPPRLEGFPAYGAVVDSVNVSVLLYVPLRSGSLAEIDCLRPMVTGSLAISLGYVRSVNGVVLLGIGANALVGCAALVALACSGLASVRSPLTRCPDATGSGSDTLSVALPAVLMTLAGTVVR